ncbi:MAG: DUF2339 domain-containing protein [Chloroflexota bacterium]|nr:DUF2339 domain-containing protein [Chloroflexota bacterium]
MFCIFCGAPLVGAASPKGEPSQEAPQGQQPLLQEELRELRRVVLQLTDRVAALEWLEGITVRPTPQREPVAPATPPSPPLAGPPPEPAPVAAGFAGGGRPLSSDAVPAAGPPEPAAPALPPRYRMPSIDWERVLGLNWLAIIGAVALAIGMGFFLKLSFDNNWIGPTGRVILGVVSGVALLGVGEYAQRRYPVWAQAVTGGGIAILYLSIYAAFGFYELILPLPAFLFLGLVVVVSGLAALRYESLVIALLGISGAFLTPVLLGSDLPDRRLLLAYILLVDVGILGVSTFRNWRWFTLVGLIASYALFALWQDRIPATELVLAQVGLTGIFLVFVGATTLFHILWRRTPRPPDMALMTLNAMAYFGLTFGLLWPRFDVWFGFISLALSLFYGMVGYGALKRSGAPPQVALYSLATALVFLTVAVPLQLSGSWITVAWAAEGAVLVWVGFVLRSWPTRAFGLGVLAVAAFRLLIFDTPVELDGFRLLLNDRFPTFAVAIAAFYAVAYLYKRERDRLEQWETNVSLVLAGAANLFTLWILSAEAIAYFDSRELAAYLQAVHQDAENGKFLSLTALWAVYAFGLLAIALAKRSRLLRWAGLGLLSVPVFKLLLVDTFTVTLNPRTFTLVLNFHFLTFLVVLAVVLFAAYLYWRQRQELLEGERYVFLALVVVANFAAVWVLSAEALRFFDSREVRLGTDLSSAKNLSLTILWAVYAIGVIGAGIVRRSSRVRLAGLALLGIPVLKLFVFDVFLLEQVYRVAAFVTLGVLLLATGLAYQRYSKAFKGFFVGDST